MRNLFNSAIAGVIAAALMVMAKLLLTQQPELLQHWHYPAFSLEGQDGLRRLAAFALWGAGYALAYNALLRSLLPGGIVLGPLSLGLVPTLVAALVLPLYHGTKAVSDLWVLFWLYAHWVLWAACFLFIVGGKGKGARKHDED
jgi:hypothetical protein